MYRWAWIENPHRVKLYRGQTDVQTDRWADRQMGRQTDGQADRWTDKQTHRQIDKCMDRRMYRWTWIENPHRVKLYRELTDRCTDRETERQTDK